MNEAALNDEACRAIAQMYVESPSRVHPEPPEILNLITPFVEVEERRRVLMVRCSDLRVIDSRPKDGRAVTRRAGDAEEGRRR